MTRAKFTCVSVTKRKGWAEQPFLFEAEMQAVHGDSEDNKRFFAMTPSGSIKLMTIRNDHFEVGKDYYVDFTPDDFTPVEATT